MAILELSKLTLFQFKFWKNVTHKWGLYPSLSHQLLLQTSGQGIFVLWVGFALLAPSPKAAELSEGGFSANGNPHGNVSESGQSNMSWKKHLTMSCGEAAQH